LGIFGVFLGIFDEKIRKNIFSGQKPTFFLKLIEKMKKYIITKKNFWPFDQKVILAEF
jgi:hypothetical protein